jgi:hypothetical protein
MIHQMNHQESIRHWFAPRTITSIGHAILASSSGSLSCVDIKMNDPSDEPSGNYETWFAARTITSIGHAILASSSGSLSCVDIKTGLHSQSFCDYSRNFTKVNSKFWRICKKCLRELTYCLTRSQCPENFLTNPSKLRIYQCKIPTVITETLIV